MTDTFPGFNDGVIAQARNRITALQTRRGMCGKWKVNSLNFHLDVKSLGDCGDIDALLGYEKYLQRKEREK